MDTTESFLSINDELKEDALSGDEEDEDNNYFKENTDTEESDTVDEEENSTDNFYLSRDKKIKWLKDPPTSTQQNKPKNSPKVLGFAKGAKTPIEAWQMFFPDSAIDEIVKHTNAFIKDVRKDYSRERDACDTSQAEIKAVLGLLYLAGVMKTSHQNLADLWAKDGTGVEYFHATISLKRFRFILYCLHFDVPNNGEGITLAPIKCLLENFTNRCIQHFSIGQDATVAELYEPFKGKCRFKKLLKNKLSKYGIKIYALIETNLFYTLNLDVDIESNKPDNNESHPNAVIQKLIEPITGSFRNITYDKKFTSLQLAKDILESHKINSIGLVKGNKREIPKQFAKQNPNNILVGFYKECTLISCSIDSNKPLVYLSTICRTNQETNNKSKPEEISFYNNTRKSADTLQELCNNYSVSRKSSRWPLTVFFFLLNIAGINSQILLQANLKSKSNRREFLISIAKSLSTDYLAMRAAAENLPQHLRMRKRQLAGIQEEDSTKKHKGGHGRCTFCSWKKNRKTTTVCSKCSKFICREHTVSTCVDCAAKNDELSQ